MEKNNNILGTGLSGLLGSRITKLLEDNFKFTAISRQTGGDITSIPSLESYFDKFTGEYVLHMAAVASVDGCEAEKDLGEESESWKVNVLATQNIADLCLKYNKKLIYISTDFVFDGEKPEEEGYTEEDLPHPINWYGETKYQGERRIIDSGIKDYSILRIAYPYGISTAPKKDFVRIIAERLKDKQPLKGVTDHIFVPTYIDDIAKAISLLIEKKESGIFHVVGNTRFTPYDAARLIAKKIGLDPGVIEQTTREEYFANKAKRPFNLYLKNDKIENLGVSMRTFEEGINLTLHV
jgi:dTDP-4-dehydrorhamnose reductase